MILRAAAGAVALVACAARAAPGEDPLAWLQRAAQAARAASYAGTFVHTNGDRTSTVRISHVMVGKDEHERIEPLDGPVYEIVRKNDEVFCQYPDAKTVRLIIKPPDWVANVKQLLEKSPPDKRKDNEIVMKPLSGGLLPVPWC